MTMYGTVARLKLQPDKEEEFIAQNAVYKDLNIPGFIATAVYRADAGDGEYWMAVVFDSKESYRANAEDPAQDQRFRQLQSLLASEPEWHDGEVILRDTAG
jgi:antibiotic biosynthesis monooxygenase (ABM) superfamily enzyme